MAFLLEIARLFIYLVIYYFFFFWKKMQPQQQKSETTMLNNYVKHLCYTSLSLDTDGKDVWILPQKTELCFLLLFRKGQ